VFSNSGPLSSAFIHAPSSSAITIAISGVCEATFTVLSGAANQFSFFLNGVSLPGGIYGTSNGGQSNTGQIVFSANVGDMLTVRNHSSAGSAGLTISAGGTQPIVNASVLITALA
jgi:hypothetical protein